MKQEMHQEPVKEKPKQKRKPRTKPLINPLEEKFCKAYIKNKGNATKSYLQVNPDIKEISAKATASKMIHRPEIQKRISVLLNSIGVDKAYLSKKIKKLMNAQRPVIVDKSLEFVADNNTQLETTKVALKLHGELQNTDAATVIDARSITINENDAITQRLGGLINAFQNIADKIDAASENINITGRYKKPGTESGPESDRPPQ